MMDVQFLSKLFFSNSTSLADMVVALANRCTLRIPFRAIVWFASATPSRVFVPAHSCTVSNGKTSAGAVLQQTAVDVIGLAVKLISATRTGNSNADTLATKTICALPSTRTFARAKVMILHCAGELFNFLFAPVTRGINRMLRALGRTINHRDTAKSPVWC